MPHITVKMYAGKSDEHKKDLAEKLAKVIMEANDVPYGAVSVIIKDILPEDWTDEVVKKDLAEREFIVKMPGYPID